MMTEMQFLDRGDGVCLAYHHRPGAGPTVVFLPGYMSDMEGTKALALDQWAAARGRSYLRFDYSGCGRSDGRFEDGTIGRWRDDALALVDSVAPGPLILVGSSMGGWVALLVAVARAARVQALVGIAAAPDFTDWGLLADFDSDQLDRLMRDGRISLPSAYGEDPYVYTRALVEDGQANRLLGRSIAFGGPVRLLHGQADDDVPWQLSLTIAEKLDSSDVQILLVKDGDHRLSRPADLKRLTATLDSLLEAPCAD